MLKKLITWLRSRGQIASAGTTSELRRSGAFTSPAAKHPSRRHDDPQPAAIETDAQIDTVVEDGGPGKNVLIRNKYVREETGTYETLKILDDSMIDSGEETGIDPYNTGDFDRSRNWDKRFRN